MKTPAIEYTKEELEAIEEKAYKVARQGIIDAIYNQYNPKYNPQERQYWINKGANEKILSRETNLHWFLQNAYGNAYDAYTRSIAQDPHAAEALRIKYKVKINKKPDNFIYKEEYKSLLISERQLKRKVEKLGAYFFEPDIVGELRRVENRLRELRNILTYH